MCLKREEAQRMVTYPVHDALDLGEKPVAVVKSDLDLGDEDPTEQPPPLVLLLDDVRD